MITQEKFDKVISEFQEFEQFRDKLYPMASNLLENGFDTEAYLLILSTWNFARFRYVMNDFELERFKNTITGLKRHFDNLADKNFENVNFEECKQEIKEIYSCLSGIKGIEYTGASKIMHLRNPHLFIMWDGYMRYHYEIKSDNYEGYIDFLKKMQSEFKNIHVSSEQDKTKSIDEYNYISISSLAIIKNKIDKLEKKSKVKKINEKQLANLIKDQTRIENIVGLGGPR